MPFEKPLLEVIVNQDIEAARRLIVPWDPDKHPLEWVEENYGGAYSPAFYYEPEIEIKTMRQLKPCEFIFDVNNEFFKQQGGPVIFSTELLDIGSGILSNEEAQRMNAYFAKYEAAHLQRLDKCVLASKQNKPYLVLGLFPESIKKFEFPVVYLYGEAGKRRLPNFDFEIRADLSLSETMPILYFAKRITLIEEGKPKRHTQKVDFYIPMSHAVP